MFVQSAQFIEQHRKELEAQGTDTSVFVSGQEKESETVKLARMNLAVNGLRGEVRQGITQIGDLGGFLLPIRIVIQPVLPPKNLLCGLFGGCLRHFERRAEGHRQYPIRDPVFPRFYRG
jgi:hypothetical protein